MLYAHDHFVERERESALIEAALHDQAHRTIIIQGAAGAGKSSLLAQVLAKQTSAGAIVGFVNHVHDSATSVEPLIHALEGMVSAGLDLLYEPESALCGLSDLLGSSVEVLADVGKGPFRRLKRHAGIVSPLDADAAEVFCVCCLMYYF